MKNKLYEYATQASKIVESWPLARQVTLCFGKFCQCEAHKKIRNSK